MKKFILNSALVILSTICALYLANEIFKLYVRHSFSPKPANPSSSQNKEFPSNEGYFNSSDHAYSYDTFPKLEFSSYLGYVPTPNYTGNGYHTNAQRFRYDDDLVTEKPQSEVRVFITGGSTAWARGVKQDQTFCYVAEKILNKQCKNKKVRVISVGASGYVSTQEYIRVITEVSYYSPDIIAMFSGVNDAYAGYRNWPIERHYDPFNLGDIISEFGKHVISSKYDYPPPDKQKYDNVYKYALDFKNYMSALLRSEKEVREILFKNAELIKQASNNLGAEFLFILQPYIYHTKKVLTEYEKNAKARRGKMEAVHITLENYIDKTYASILEELPRESKRAGYTYYNGDNAIINSKDTLFIDDCHFGDRGNKAIGEYLAKILVPYLNKFNCQCSTEE